MLDEISINTIVGAIARQVYIIIIYEIFMTSSTGCPQGLNVNIPAFFGKSLYKFQPIRVDFGYFFQPFYAKSTLFPAILDDRKLNDSYMGL